MKKILRIVSLDARMYKSTILFIELDFIYDQTIILISSLCVNRNNNNTNVLQIERGAKKEKRVSVNNTTWPVCFDYSFVLKFIQIAVILWRKRATECLTKKTHQRHQRRTLYLYAKINKKQTTKTRRGNFVIHQPWTMYI